MAGPPYDVFLCYNHADRPAVESIAQDLREFELRVCLDVWEFAPGRSWQDHALAAIAQSSAVAVFLGPAGVGGWQKREIELALERQVCEDVPVIPVQLPGRPPELELPNGFLRSHTMVDFTQPAERKRALERLYFGVTGQRPAQRAAAYETPRPAVTGSASHEALGRLGALLRSGNVTFFVGGSASLGEGGGGPSAYQIGAQLLRELGLAGAEPLQLLPALDDVGSFFAAQRGARELEDRFAELTERREGAPLLLRRLGELLRVLAARRTRRVRRRTPQLIVTTNVDVMLERALLLEGLEFSRVVLHRAGQRVFVNEYRGVRADARGGLELAGEGGAPLRIAHGDFAALDEAICSAGERRVHGGPGQPAEAALSIAEFAPPVVLKLLGSLDLPDSCALCAEQQLALLRRLPRLVPAEVREIVANTPALFLGYSVLDPDFRLLYCALLEKSFEAAVEEDVRYALRGEGTADEDAYRRIESALWPQLKSESLKRLGISLLESNPPEFLEQLGQRVRADSAA